MRHDEVADAAEQVPLLKSDATPPKDYQNWIAFWKNITVGVVAGDLIFGTIGAISPATIEAIQKALPPWFNIVMPLAGPATIELLKFGIVAGVQRFCCPNACRPKEMDLERAQEEAMVYIKAVMDNEASKSESVKAIKATDSETALLINDNQIKEMPATAKALLLTRDQLQQLKSDEQKAQLIGWVASWLAVAAVNAAGGSILTAGAAQLATNWAKFTQSGILTAARAGAAYYGGKYTAKLSQWWNKGKKEELPQQAADVEARYGLTHS